MRLNPFRAIRPRPELAARVAAVPYDVVNRDEAAELARGIPTASSTSAGRTSICPRLDPYDARIYAGAREALDELARRRDPAPRPGAGALPLPPGDGRAGPDRGGGLRARGRLRAGPHPEAREDPAGQGGRPHPARAHPERERGAGVPHLPRPGRDRRAGGADRATTTPLYDFTAPDGVRHTVWRVPDSAPLVRALSPRCPTPTWPTGTTARPAPGARGRSCGRRTPRTAATRSTTGSSRCSSRRTSSGSCPTTGWCGTSTGRRAAEVLDRLRGLGRLTPADGPGPGPERRVLRLSRRRAGTGWSWTRRAIDRTDPIALARRVAAPGPGAGADPRHRRSADRQADRFRRRHPGHGGAGAAGELGRDGDRVLALSRPRWTS